jgi:hypothetical protein
VRGRLIPWPWTLNVAGRAELRHTGQGLRRHSPGACSPRRPIASTPASAKSTSATTRTATSIPANRSTPYRNLAIAAEILQEQHTPGEDWLIAIGRYHRPAGGRPPPATAAVSTST